MDPRIRCFFLKQFDQFEEENKVFEHGQGPHKDRAYMKLQLDKLDEPAKPVERVQKVVEAAGLEPPYHDLLLQKGQK